MIKTLIKLKILKFILIGGVSAAYAFKKWALKMLITLQLERLSRTKLKMNKYL